MGEDLLCDLRPNKILCDLRPPKEEAIEVEAREACVLRDAFAIGGRSYCMCDL